MATEPAIREIDLTADEPESTAPSEIPIFEASPVQQSRERIRGTLALVLVGLLSALVLLVLGSVVFGTHTADSVDTIKEVLAIILGPVVGLVGAVTGFYFGEQSRVQQ